MEIIFQPEGKKVHATSKDHLLKIAEQAGILIDASCAGAGKCGKCKVKVLSGSCNPLTDTELNLLSGHEIKSQYRLACCTYAHSDLEVMIPKTHGGSNRKKKLTKLPSDFCPENRIFSSCMKVPKATMKYQKNDLERIQDTFKKPDMTLSKGLLNEIHPALDAKRGQVTATFKDQLLLSLTAGDQSDNCYGIAFDIGTTTVVGMLWNLHTNELVDVEAKTNYQSVYGSDVISRIQFCNTKPENLSIMQKKVINCLNDILEELCTRNQIDSKFIYDVTVVGNTTMSHLFLGVTPNSLARTPFAPVFCSAQNTQAKDLNLNVCPQANVYLLPNIAGHVGSDIVAMILSSGIYKMKGCHIAIDIGTNGEIVAMKDGQMVTCSTAAGPAFEGATIAQGMRAASGAIESVEITSDNVILGTIDHQPAIGICGSGLIDIVAELLRSKIIDGTGRMMTQEEALEMGLHKDLAARITGSAPNVSFRLTSSGAETTVSITQQDIREVQLAKGAILAGIQTLMKTLEIEKDQIDSIMIAGAFGNYIQKENALCMGLFPDIPLEKIISIGNAAGAGSSMALLSDKTRELASSIAINTEHIELSMNMDFQEFYIYAMNFK